MDPNIKIYDTATLTHLLDSGTFDIIEVDSMKLGDIHASISVWNFSDPNLYEVGI